MTTYNVVHATHHTLVANTVDIVNLSDPVTLIIVTNGGTDDIYFRFAGNGANATNPTVAGDDCYRVRAGEARTYSRPLSTNSISQIRLISASATPYSVEGL